VILNVFFCGEHKSVNYLFVECYATSYLWVWIYRYNTCTFSYNSIRDLWCIDAIFSYKNSAVCVLTRGNVI
jgi:hypothetical protein